MNWLVIIAPVGLLLGDIGACKLRRVQSMGQMIADTSQALVSLPHGRLPKRPLEGT